LQKKIVSDQVKVIIKGNKSIPQSAALLTRGGTGISSSDFFTLLNREQASTHK